MTFLKNKTLLVTGGTGSFGRAFLKKILKSHKDIKKLIIFSRDELKQFEMSQVYNPKKYKFLRFFIGDIRDSQRLERALEGVDYVIHAAALKQVVTSEYNPFETIKTNVIGSQNLIEACLNKSVKKVIALSTDKASSPVNLYGATKLCSDKLFISANGIKGKRDIMFSVVRYGNVMGSRGSVIPVFNEQKKNQVLTITDKRMTRFSLPIEESVDLVLHAIKNAVGGEIFVPKISSFRVLDLAKAICDKCTIKVVGIRPGEKLHEELISSHDSVNTFDMGEYYIITDSSEKLINFYKNEKKVPLNFNYNSFTNTMYLTVKQIKNLLIKTKLI
jgi:UDP-N-acetylglucosamine 4,6-dehydratase/5-epimerase